MNLATLIGKIPEQYRGNLKAIPGRVVYLSGPDGNVYTAYCTPAGTVDVINSQGPVVRMPLLTDELVPADAATWAMLKRLEE